MKKRLTAILLALVLAFTLLPATAYARVGNFMTTDAERAAVRTLTTTDFAGRQYMVLQNDYITFAVQCSSGSGNELYSYTAPTALLDGSIKNIFLFPMEITRFRSHDGEASSWSAGKDLRITGIKGSNEKDPTVENPNTVITLELTMSDSRLAATMTFYLQRVELGENDSAVAGGQHWGVDASTRFRLTGAWDDDLELAAYQSKEYPLSTMGHKSADAAPLQMSTVEHVYKNWKYDGTAFYTQTLSDSLGLTGTSTSTDTGERDYINRKHTEVYTTSYVCGNPFVAMSSDYYGDDSHGLAYYPQQVESNGGKVTTYNNFDTLKWVDGEHSDRQDMFWGFRNLYAAGDQDAPTEPDKVTVSGDKLYIIPDGDGFRVTTAASNNAAAVVRGKFTLENSAYNFTGGAAALSPTVTATWGSGGYFRIKSDGTIEHSGVNLNAPSFKFFAPAESSGTSGLKMEFTGDGLDMTFDPDKNNAIFALNIPYASVQVKKGTADMDGNLIFSGDMSISTVFDGLSFTMEELGYGLKNGSFTVNGVHATGSFKTASLIGLELMEVAGEINTFQGRESYGFELELDVFSLFEAKAELELKRCNNGTLMPNNLYFYVAAEPGIPLVPPVPTTFITGGGAGFYGLADTVNGDWFAIPPIKLRGSVSVQFVTLLEASPANIMFGPSVYEVSSEDVKFAKVKVGFNGGYGMYLNGDKVTYDNNEYKGLTASGKIWMNVDLPSKEWNFLTMGGEVAAGIFGGMNGLNLYMRAYGNSRAEARIQTPTSWGKLIGGKKLAGVGVDAAVVGQTWINGESRDFDTIVSSAFDSMKLQVGLAGTTTFLGSGFRVWVIVPDAAQSAKKNWNWGYDFKFLRSLPRWDWDGTALNVPSNANAAPMLMAADADDILFLAPDEDVPTLTPGEDVPVLTPDGDAPVLTPGEDAPVLTPDGDAPVLTPGEDVPVLTPDENGPVLTPGEDAPVLTPGEDVPVLTPGEDVPVLTPDEDAPVLMPDEDVPVLTPDEDVPVLTSDDNAILTASAAPVTITVSDVSDDEQVAYLVLSFPETTVIDLSQVTVSKDGDSSFTFTPVQIAVNPDGTITNGDSANIISDVLPLADGTGSELVLIIKVGQGTGANGAYTVNLGSSDSQIQPVFSMPNVISPADRLGSVSFSSGSVSGRVEYPEADTTYVVRTYLGVEKGGADYLLDESVVTNADHSFNVSFSASGTAAPTGSYYLTTYLMKEVTYTPEGSIDPETAYIAIGSDSSDSAIVAYNNNTTNTPAAPTNVTLAAAGNETMVASWSGVSDADGYKITIYEQNEKGEWIDSGYGYEYDAAQFPETVNGEKNKNHITGLSIDENGNYTIDMAVTMGGQGATKNNSSEIKGYGKPEALEANQSYKVGVTAYKSESVEIAEKTQTVKYYGSEAQSADAFLPEYTPLNINFALHAEGASDSAPLSADTDGIYNAYINGSNYELLVNDSSVSSNATFTVTRMDTRENLAKSSGGYPIPAFEGMLMLEVTGSVTDATYNITDTTTCYVLISRDDVAPIVTMDEDTFYTGGTRDFTITGITEPGAAVSMNYTYDTVVILYPDTAWSYEEVQAILVTDEVVAGADGSFTFTGTLRGDAESIFFSVAAKDAAGNLGNGSAIVNVGKDPNSDPDPDPDPVPPSPGTGGVTYPVSVPSDVAGGAVTANPRSASKDTTVTVTVTPNDGYRLDSLTVTDSQGNELTLTDRGGGKYTFTMPGSKVTVEASFAEIQAKPAISFTDVSPGAYYYEAVLWAAENDITNGANADGTMFSPNAPCTRAQAVTFLWRAAGSPAPKSGVNPFTDVQPGAYYYEAVLWAVENGITVGTSSSTFSPNVVCSRAQIVTFLWRSEGQPAASTGSSFVDVSASAYYAGAVAWAVENGITVGTSSSTFSPNDDCTRAQIVTFLYRCMA